MGGVGGRRKNLSSKGFFLPPGPPILFPNLFIVAMTRPGDSGPFAFARLSWPRERRNNHAKAKTGLAWREQPSKDGAWRIRDIIDMDDPETRPACGGLSASQK